MYLYRARPPPYPDTLELWPPNEVKKGLLVCFVERRRFLARTHPDILKRLVAGRGRLTEPNNRTTCYGIDLGHGLDLLTLFVRVCLVDTDSIYPYDPIHEAISKIQQRYMQVRPNTVFTVVDQHGPQNPIHRITR